MILNNFIGLLHIKIFKKMARKGKILIVYPNKFYLL